MMEIQFGRYGDNGTLLLLSGKRFGVLVTATGNGSIPLQALAYCPYMDTIIETVNVKGNQKGPAKTIPMNLTPKKDLNLGNITNNRVLTFSSNELENRFIIDNKTVDPVRIDQKVKIGTIEQGRLINHDEGEHTFYIHVNDYQMVSVNGKPYDAHGLQDMVLIPGHGEVAIRIQFEDYVGKSVCHCHIMFHEDHGMMGIFDR
jgi:suppressor of ftsI